VTALARLDGRTVAVSRATRARWAARGPQLHRANDAAGGIVETFRCRWCTSWTLAASPRLAGGEAGTIRDGTRAIATIYQSTVPWCAVILRRAFGVAGAGMIDHTRFRYRIAWPSGDWGSLPVDGGLEAAFKAQIELRPPGSHEARDRARLERLRSPFRSASGSWWRRSCRRGDAAVAVRVRPARGARCGNCPARLPLPL